GFELVTEHACMSIESLHGYDEKNRHEQDSKQDSRHQGVYEVDEFFSFHERSLHWSVLTSLQTIMVMAFIRYSGLHLFPHPLFLLLPYLPHVLPLPHRFQDLPRIPPQTLPPPHLPQDLLPLTHL